MKTPFWYHIMSGSSYRTLLVLLLLWKEDVHMCKLRSEGHRLSRTFLQEHYFKIFMFLISVFYKEDVVV